jgi:glycosyltransferase involved in cell wall biosynthesis
MTIRVLYDDQIFQLQKHGGISRYFSELIKEFNQSPELGIEPVLTSTRTVNNHLLNDSGLTFLKKNSALTGVLKLLIKSMFRFSSAQPNLDLVHHTFYLPGFFSRWPGIPKVSTLHDMIPERFPAKNRLWNPHFSKRLYLEKSDLLLSVSNSSAQEMSTLFRLDRIVPVTHLGVGSQFQPGLPRPPVLSEQYFLYVGNRGGYKDFETGLIAFASIAQSFTGVKLQLVGGGKFSRAEQKLIARLGVTDRVNQSEVKSEDLPSFYSNAVALVYPTHYEGFGLPLVEAMASGTPILCASTPINEEVCGKAGSFFEPGAHSHLAALMSEVLQAPENFQNKVEIGLEKSKTFSWRRCAEETAMAYKSLLNQKEGRGF